MKEKIDWYREVLDLEPGSKVFFPLAKLLAQNNEDLHAIDVLHQGLERHPEYVEARLYLVELLHKNLSQGDNKESLENQLTFLTPLLARYAGFWKAWGSSNQISSQKGDVGLAIAFLAALFQDDSLSLSEIVSKGLNMVLGEDTKSIGAEITTNGGVETNKPASTHIVDAAQSNILPKPYKDDSAWSDEDDEDEDGEERFSLRTRSMAEVLAEQGDFAGSLEIYQELVDATTSVQEKEDLQSRMNTLSTHLGTVDEKIEVKEGIAKSPGKDRILSVLETLAERLESRAQ